MWNCYCIMCEFEVGKLWLLCFFDEICFYEVSEVELCVLCEDFIVGCVKLKIEELVFDLCVYNCFLYDEVELIVVFKVM